MPRQRSRKNKDVKTGTANCQWGLCKKGSALSETYNVDVVIVTRRPDGFMGGFQSRPGLMRELSQVIEEDTIMGPDQFQGGRHRFLNSHRPSLASTAHPSPAPSTLSALSDKPSSELEAPSSVFDMSFLDDTAGFQIDPYMLLQSPIPWCDQEVDYTNLMSDNAITQRATLANMTPESTSSKSENDRISISEACREFSSPNILQPVPVSAKKRQAVLSLLEKYL